MLNAYYNARLLSDQAIRRFILSGLVWSARICRFSELVYRSFSSRSLTLPNFSRSCISYMCHLLWLHRPAVCRLVSSRSPCYGFRIKVNTKQKIQNQWRTLSNNVSAIYAQLMVLTCRRIHVWETYNSGRY